jgi:hypothetical protein
MSEEKILIPGTLRGYRVWSVFPKRKGGAVKLHPVHQNAHTAWEPGENVAKCSGAMNHSAPGESCTCGFYASYTMGGLISGPGYVVGVVEGYGRVFLHETGFRAEKMAIKAVWMPQPTWTLTRYPGVKRYFQRRDMLADFPPPDPKQIPSMFGPEVGVSWPVGPSMDDIGVAVRQFVQRYQQHLLQLATVQIPGGNWHMYARITHPISGNTWSWDGTNWSSNG